MTLDQRLQRLWYGPAWRSLPFWPLSALFRLVVGMRRVLYRIGIFRTHHVAVPVVVVGNITVGGTGKTPVAGWLARQLTLRGHRVGIVLRGYGGAHRGAARIVVRGDDPMVTGDEALLHASRGMHVVVIGADRVVAASRAAEAGADIVVCDDGLQHARLARNYEIAIIDGRRRLGNGWMLPAGPLRDPAARLESVNAVVITERATGDGPEGAALPHVRGPLCMTARLELGEAVNLSTGARRDLRSFAGTANLHAVAAIGHPDAFFAGLKQAGLHCVEHPLPDHAALEARALPFPIDATVLMTQKDAVKCRDYVQAGWWWVDLEVGIEREAARLLLDTVLERTGLMGAGVRLG